MDNLWIIYGESMENLWIWLVVGFYPSEKYEFVNWDDYIFPTEWENKSHVPNHQTAELHNSPPASCEADERWWGKPPMWYLHVCCGIYRKMIKMLCWSTRRPGVEPMTNFLGALWKQYITARIPGFWQTSPPIPPTKCAEARRTQVADATFRDQWGL